MNWHLDICNGEKLKQSTAKIYLFFFFLSSYGSKSTALFNFTDVMWQTRPVQRITFGIIKFADVCHSMISVSLLTLEILTHLKDSIFVDRTKSWMKKPVNVSAKEACGPRAVDLTKNWTDHHVSACAKTNLSLLPVGPTRNLMKKSASVYVKRAVLDISH